MLETWHNHEWFGIIFIFLTHETPNVTTGSCECVIEFSAFWKKWVFGFKFWDTSGKATHCVRAIDIVWLKEEEIVTAPKYFEILYTWEIIYYGHLI